MSVDEQNIAMPPLDFTKAFPRISGADLRPGRVSTIPEDEKHLSDSTKMLLAMSATGRPIYEGTVDPATVARRRAKNRAARHARRVHRR